MKPLADNIPAIHPTSATPTRIVTIAELEREIKRLTDDYHIQGKILAVSNRILSSGHTVNSLEHTFEGVIEICQAALGGHTSVIELYDEEKDCLLGVATDHQAYNPEGYFQLPLTESSLSGLAYLRRETIAIDDVKNDSRVSQRIREQFDASSGIASPLLVDDKPIGVLLTMMTGPIHHFSARDITLMEGLAAEAALAVHTQMLRKSRLRAEHRFQRLVEYAPSAIFLLDPRFVIQEANRTSERLLGMDNEALLGMNLIKFVALLERDSAKQFFANLEFDRPRKLETSFRNLDGEQFAVEINASLLSIEGQTVIQVFVIDITLRKHAEIALHQEKERAQTTLRAITNAVITTDHSGRIASFNPAAAVITGWDSAATDGRSVFEVLHIDVDPLQGNGSFSSAIEDGLMHGRTTELVQGVTLINRSGLSHSVEVSVAPIHNRDGDNIGAVIVIDDVSEAVQMAEKMSYLATHDTLTGLVNRGEFDKRLKDALNDAKRTNNEHALCYVDLDRFKIVNDTVGHLAGDQLLIQLTSMLQATMRGTDTLARLGGDEFGIILRRCKLDDAVNVAENIRKIVKQFRFSNDGKTFEIGASIGVVALNAASTDVQEVLSAVDSACYLAKEQGRNRVQVYQHDDEQLTSRHSEMQLTHRIRSALEANRMCLWYQAIVPAKITKASPLSHEIFVRMIDEQGAIVPPGLFLGAAERYQIMPEIDRWVVENTLKAIKAGRLLTNPQDTCFINLSGQSLSDPEFLAFVEQVLRRYNVRTQQICFELTETAAIHNLADAIQFFTRLRAKGCRFALDDFGSGLSSFGYLKNLPVDFLKIDGQFIRDIATNPVDRAMVESINNIGHALHLQTIGEYVETAAAMQVLIELGVDYLQGFHLDRPKAL